MTPLQVKQLAVLAVENNDPKCALDACREIKLQDLYLNVPKPRPTHSGKETIARWGNRPCKGGCGKIIKPGERVWWEPNWGVSHLECKEEGR